MPQPEVEGITAQAARRAPAARANLTDEKRLREAVLSELISIATDPNEPHVVVPAIRKLPDEMAPRLRPRGRLPCVRPG